MSDKEPKPWTIRGVDDDTRNGIIAMADLHRCTLGPFVRFMYRKIAGLPVNDANPYGIDKHERSKA